MSTLSRASGACPLSARAMLICVSVSGTAITREHPRYSATDATRDERCTRGVYFGTGLGVLEYGAASGTAAPACADVMWAADSQFRLELRVGNSAVRRVVSSHLTRRRRMSVLALCKLPLGARSSGQRVLARDLVGKNSCLWIAINAVQCIGGEGSVRTRWLVLAQHLVRCGKQYTYLRGRRN